MEQPQTFYEIRVKDHLDAKWSAWFDGLTIVNASDGSGEATLRGSIPDQAALHGILARIRDLNLTLISVSRIEDSRVPASKHTKEE